MGSRGARSVLAAIAITFSLAAVAPAADAPHYDVPAGFIRCPRATAWNGFFKWASGKHTDCRRVRRFMLAYGGRAHRAMPHRVAGFSCRIRYWRNEDGDIYASRHVCARDEVVIRFYGMV